MPRHYGDDMKAQKPQKGAKQPVKKKGPNPWMAHLAKVRKANKGMSLKEAMKKAKSTYKKK